jgi:hypothetical protein
VLWAKDYNMRYTPGYAIFGLAWPKVEDGHAVVAHNGKIVHDPCNCGRRITDEDMLGSEIEYAVVFTVLDPKGIHAQS